MSFPEAKREATRKKTKLGRLATIEVSSRKTFYSVQQNQLIAFNHRTLLSKYAALP